MPKHVEALLRWFDVKKQRRKEKQWKTAVAPRFGTSVCELPCSQNISPESHGPRRSGWRQKPAAFGGNQTWSCWRMQRGGTIKLNHRRTSEPFPARSVQSYCSLAAKRPRGLLPSVLECLCYRNWSYILWPSIHHHSFPEYCWKMLKVVCWLYKRQMFPKVSRRCCWETGFGMTRHLRRLQSWTFSTGRTFLSGQLEWFVGADCHRTASCCFTCTDVVCSKNASREGRLRAEVAGFELHWSCELYGWGSSRFFKNGCDRRSMLSGLGSFQDLEMDHL